VTLVSAGAATFDTRSLSWSQRRRTPRPPGIRPPRATMQCWPSGGEVSPSKRRDPGSDNRGRRYLLAVSGTKGPARYYLFDNEDDVLVDVGRSSRAHEHLSRWELAVVLPALHTLGAATGDGGPIMMPPFFVEEQRADGIKWLYGADATCRCFPAAPPMRRPDSSGRSWSSAMSSGRSSRMSSCSTQPADDAHRLPGVAEADHGPSPGAGA